VVLRHLEQQLRDLGGTDPAASRAIASIIVEEQEHHDRSAARAGPDGVLTRVLGVVVSGSTEAVIWLGMRMP
jgi:ubiquinone biosynthesis monooxygenase Coq7